MMSYQNTSDVTLKDFGNDEVVQKWTCQLRHFLSHVLDLAVFVERQQVLARTPTSITGNKYHL